MMIGPSSGPSPSGMPAREVVENPVRVKRKVFDDLDIESLCEDVCHTGKKRFLTEVRTPLDASLQTIIDPSEFSPSSTVHQVANGGGSVARLEVLVVDGTWDPSSLEHAEFADISSSIGNTTEIQTINDVQSVDNGYSTILSYWQPTNPSESAQNGTNGHEIPVAPAPPIPPPMPCPPAEDQENCNLSWLLDFKLDSFIGTPEEAGRTSFPTSREIQNGQRNRYNGNGSRTNGIVSYANESRRNYGNQNDNLSNVSPMHQEIRQSTLATGPYALPDNRSIAASRYGGPKKPPFTYTELIEHALQERGELTVSAIYQWISEHFPYYKSNDDRWKNSVRHNLSINPHFRKGSKAPHGAGHLWAIANRGDSRPRQLTSNGTTSLLTPRQFAKSISDCNNVRKQNNSNSEIVTMDEVAAATASISQPEENNVIASSVTLEHCAEEIMSGIKREVEVQYLVPMVVPVNDTEQEHGQIQQAEQTEQPCPVKETDFLNPVSKEEVAEECGLIGESYLVTDLNPTTLGLNMVEPEIINSDNLFGEELSFQFYEFTSPSQLQSA